MATIDIGKIKPVFKGTYDNSTAYVLDDIVYYNGSSYVAKTSTTGNLPTDTTKWNVLASGSGGVWDSTLSIGSAGQVVKVNSGATALEFGTISSDYVKIATQNVSSAVASVNFDNSELQRFVVKILCSFIQLRYIFLSAIIASLSSPPINTLSGSCRFLIAVPSAKNSGFDKTVNFLLLTSNSEASQLTLLRRF